MSTSNPVDRIAAMLEEAGYRRLKSPLTIGGVVFDVTTAFVGSKTSNDLIVVADTAFEKEDRLLRNIVAITRALDVAKSTRPLTTIVAGPRPSPATMEALSKVCRVLPVGVGHATNLEATLANWLAVLMPLDIPEPRQSVTNPLGEVELQIKDLDPNMVHFLALAKRGKKSVEDHFYSLVNDALSGAST